MSKNLPRKLMIFPSIIRIKKPARYMLVGLIVILVASHASAQNLKNAALQQIKFLMAEKAARTPAQKKIDSHILLTFKKQNDVSFARELSSVRTGIKINTGNKIKVEMDAYVSPQLLNDLKALGADIIFSSQQFKNIVANIPLNKIEQIAEMKAVIHISQWMEPKHNDPGNNYGANNAEGTFTGNADTKTRPGFATRANNVRRDLDKVLGPDAYNGKSDFIGAVTSEADVTHRADLARAVFGVTGAGVKIGVLSDGVNDYASSQASGDLPPVITVLPGQEGDGYEGRAMMELIHDIAPGAELYFATAFTSQASFAQNILDLRAAGCDIIVDDVTYYAEAVFQDDNVAQAVNAVTASGALYFSAAGNSGNKNDGTAGVWEGDFVNGGSLPLFPDGVVNNFGAGFLYNIVTATTGLVSLKWSDPLGQSANDYDMFATDPTGAEIIDYSTDIQDGNDNPYEYLHYNFPAGYRFYIVQNAGSKRRALHLNTNGGLLAFSTPGVMYGHNAAGSAYTVAATPAAIPFYSVSPPGPYPNPFNSTNVVERFSSDGPRRIFFNPDGTAITPGNVLFKTNGGTLLQKPDITAADGVSTNTPLFETFYGTSAAAPDAAAIAGLVKSKFPAFTPDQIRAALISSAIDIEAPGMDRDAGAGIVMAYEALDAAGATAVAIRASSPVRITAENAVPPNNAPDPGETVTVKLPLVNIGNVSTTNLVATLQPTGGVTDASGPKSYGAVPGGGSVSVEKAFTFTAVGNCGDSITLTLALQDGSDDLGTITYRLKLGGSGPLNTPVAFANTTPIATNLSVNPADPYPSNITVSGLTGKVAKLSVALKQLNYTWVGDVDILLVSPSGKKMVIMSDVDESSAGAANIDIMLSDDGSILLPAGGGIASGSYKPTNYGSGDAFPSPAPEAPYVNAAPAGTATLNGTFGGEDPNGTWSLYVVDDYIGLDSGSFDGGWELTITTTDDVCSEVKPAISIADKTLQEGTNGYKLMYFNVTLSEKPAKKVTVKYRTKNGTALSGSDYKAQSGTLVFPAGKLKTQKIPIVIKGDKIAEGTETFSVVLSDAVNATMSDSVATGTILDNSGAAIADVSEDAASIALLGSKAINLSPNPATVTTNISLNGYSGNIVILVSDMNGKILQQRKLQLKSSKSGLEKIDVSAYAAGSYLVTIIDEKGNKKTEKLVISR